MSDEFSRSGGDDVWKKRFIPERLTPLFFTPSWENLRPHERLRYNQLHGLYFHEQIVFFEQQLIVPMLNALKPRVTEPQLREAVERFIAEENEHSAAFRALLRQLRPAWYAEDGGGHFVRMGGASRAILSAWVKRAPTFPMFLWLVQLLEERTMFASRLYLAEAGEFPEAILSLQRRHLADEADHVQWDIALIDHFWGRTPGWLRRINARLLDWMLREFIAVPKRAALSVIDALAEEIPDLSIPAGTLKAELRALARRRDFQGAVFGRDAVPRTWKLATSAPDLELFVNNWLAHEHTP